MNRREREEAAIVEATTWERDAWKREDFSEYAEARIAARILASKREEAVVVLYDETIPECFSDFGFYLVDSRSADDAIRSRYELDEIPATARVAFIAFPTDRDERREVRRGSGLVAYTTTALFYRDTAERSAQEDEIRRMYGEEYASVYGKSPYAIRLPLAAA